MIGRRCTHGDVFSRPVLIGRGLDRTYNVSSPAFVLAMECSETHRDIDFPVAMAAGTHPFPFRTRPLSPPAPMVLGDRSPGRVGRRRGSSIDDARPRGGRRRVCDRITTGIVRSLYADGTSCGRSAAPTAPRRGRRQAEAAGRAGEPRPQARARAQGTATAGPAFLG